MLRPLIAICLCVLLAQPLLHAQDGADAAPAEHGPSRAFPEQNYRLTLPEGASWNADMPLARHTVISYEIPDQALVFVLAVPTKTPVVIAPAFVRGFERDFIGDRPLTREKGSYGEFLGLRSYDTTLAFTDSDSVFRIRVFNSTTHSYQIQVIGGPELREDGGVADACFASFAFLAPPDSAESASDSVVADTAPADIAIGEPERPGARSIWLFLAIAPIVVGVIALGIRAGRGKPADK